MTEKYTIVVATELTNDAIRVLREADNVILKEVAPKTAIVRDNLHDAHAVITRDTLRIDEPMLDHAPNLKVIAQVAARLSNVDIEVATMRGIMVMNTPGASAIAAGEHALALMLALCRRLPTAHNSIRDGYWLLDRQRQAGVQLHGKILGLIGLGSVGQVVAHRAIAFGMTILAYDPYIAEDSVDERIQLVGLKELLERSDFVSLHVPLTRETEGLISATALEQMKPGARLINIAHGLITDELALSEALKSGHLAGVAVDVFPEEPPYNSPLIGLDSVVHTPHISDNTLEAMQDISMRVVEQVLDALADRDYRNVVNMPIMPGLNYNEVRPYMMLAERMGQIFHTLSRSLVRRVAVEASGEDMNGLIKPITVGVLKGLLSPIPGNTVSSVNAPILAHERGWQVTQAKGLSTEYANMVNIRVTLENGEDINMSGTLLDKQTPYIVQINDYRMKFVPEGILLLMGSQDKPGVIGHVGTMFSEHGINIAGWYTGRSAKGGNTLSVINLDELMPDDTFKELGELDFVRHVHQVELQ